MTNPQGTPIWYELATEDPAQVAPFYQAVMGWTISAQAEPLATGMDYRMIERAGGGFAGGVAVLNEQMKAGGFGPGWLIYFGVDDVDASAEQATQLGARTYMGPTTLEGVGRIAMLADPQGATFYLMRGASDEDSTAFTGMTPGGCCWNELSTGDVPAAVEFYGKLLGYGTDNFMPMGEDARYVFIELAGQAIGAIGPCQANGPTAWLPYFRVSGTIDAAKQAAESSGGKVMMGPMEVPGGDWIIVASDPAGATVGFVGAKA